MRAARFALVLLVGACALAAVPAADSVPDTLAALRKAKTKDDRLAALKGKDGDFLGELLTRIFNEQAALLVKGEFAEVDRMQVWAEEIAGLMPDEFMRDFYGALCQLGKGRNYAEQGWPAEAAAVFKALLADVRKKKFKLIEPAVVSNLGAVQYQQGDFVGALKSFRESHEVMKDFAPEVRAALEAQVLGNVGQLHTELGDYPAAEKALKESLALADKRRDATTATKARLNLANLDQHRGRYREAIKAYEDILADARKTGQKLLVGQVLNNLGLAQEEAGRPGEAIERLEEARKLAADLGLRRSEAMALYNLALVQMRLDQHEDAARYLLRAIKLFQAVGDKAGLARCHKLAGLLHLDAGRREEAEKEFAECLRLIRETGSKESLAEMQFIIGSTYLTAGEWKRAGEAFEESLRAYQALDDTRRILLTRYARLWVMVATDDPRYDAEFKQFLADAKRSQYQEVVAEATYLAALGLVLREQWGEAEQLAQAAVRDEEAMHDPGLAPQLQAARAAKHDALLGGYAVLAAARAGRGDFAGAFAATERAKARVLSAMLRGGVQRGMTPGEKADEERLRGTLTAATRKFESIRQFASDDPKAPEQIKKELADATAEYERFRRNLYAAHPELRAQRGDLPAVDLVELQRTLFARQPNIAIVSYLAHFDRVLIVVVTAGEKPDGPAKVVVRTVTVRPKELAAEAESFARACQSPEAGRPKSDKLWKWLVAPVEKDIAGKGHLVIAPCHPLLSLPFQALAPNADRKTPYLIERHALSYAPSVAALLQMRKRGDAVRVKNGSGGVLAVGGVAFTPDLKELKHSGPEAEAVAKTYGAGARLLTGKQPTRAALLKSVTGARVLHFATHGLPNGSRPLFSALAVAPDGDDGRLYGHDITGLDLSAELVVLSACETAKGREYRGEGTIGLAWSFFVAGAPAAVVTQWSVDDAATAVLMAEFHARLKAGDGGPPARPREGAPRSEGPGGGAGGPVASKAEALRQAQFTLLKQKETRHPFFWAPFVLTGDWRN